MFLFVICVPCPRSYCSLCHVNLYVVLLLLLLLLLLLPVLFLIKRWTFWYMEPLPPSSYTGDSHSILKSKFKNCQGLSTTTFTIFKDCTIEVTQNYTISSTSAWARFKYEHLVIKHYPKINWSNHKLQIITKCAIRKKHSLNPNTLLQYKNSVRPTFIHPSVPSFCAAAVSVWHNESSITIHHVTPPCPPAQSRKITASTCVLPINIWFWWNHKASSSASVQLRRLRSAR